MPHIDPEYLALIALGEADDEPHLKKCGVCAAELAELRHVVDLGRSSASAQLETPPEAVWQRIESELGFTPGSTGQEKEGDPSAPIAAEPESTPPRRARRPRRRMAWALAAAIVVVAAIGVTGRLVGTPGSAQQQIAAATLDAFPAHPDAAGSASVLDTRDGSRLLEVQLESSQPADGYREVWLIDADNSALISLGILQGGAGSFFIPDGVSLDAYNLVDVSVEPVDGDPQHSGDSIVRGPLQFE